MVFWNTQRKVDSHSAYVADKTDVIFQMHWVDYMSLTAVLSMVLRFGHPTASQEALE